MIIPRVLSSGSPGRTEFVIPRRADALGSRRGNGSCQAKEESRATTESRGIRKRARPQAIPSRAGRYRGDCGYRRPARRMLLRVFQFGAGGSGERGQARGRLAEGRADRRFRFGHPRPAQGPHLSRHGPCAVALPAVAAAEHPCTDGIRPGRGDQPARLDVQLGHPAPAGHHLPRRQAAHRRRRHLHVQADHQREADRRELARADRRERAQEARQPHRSGADDQPLRQLPRSARVLVLPVHRADRLRSEPPERNRRVQIPVLHTGPAQCVRQEPELLEAGPSLCRHADDHRLQRQRIAAERARGRRHSRRWRPGGPAVGRTGVDRERADRQVSYRGDHALHHARRPGAVQRRQRPAGDAAARRPPAAHQFVAGRGRGGGIRRVRPRTTPTTTPRCTGCRTSPRQRAC